MRLKLASIIWLLWCGTALAATCPALPFTYINGTLADATQVNANFNSVIGCFHDLLNITDTTVSTSTLTGSINTAGGLGVQGAIYSGKQSTLNLAQIDLTQTDGSGGTLTGNATILWQPPLNDSHTVGMMGVANIGTLSSATAFPSLYNCKWGQQASLTTYVATGVEGSLSCYESTVATKRAPADSAPNYDSHFFGATLLATQGDPWAGVAIDLIYNTTTITAGTAKLFNGTFDNFISNPNTVGMFLTAVDHVGGGTGNATSGIEIYGNWTNGLDPHGHSIINATSVSFAQTSTADPISATDYSLVGSATDTFRIVGGGSAGGINLFGATAHAHALGALRFQDAVDTNSTVALIDFATGMIRAGNGIFTTVPACGGTNLGAIITFTDSTTTTWGATITVGGGTNKVLGYCDGTNWTVAAK